MANLLNLYIDESGRCYIGEPRYRFFLVSAIVISSDERKLSSLLFSKWRKKYLVNPQKCFHAYDFFEEGQEGYRKQELVMGKNFKRAVADLKALLHNVTFSAEVYYVDIERLRYKKGIRKPPLRRPGENYSSAKQQYQLHIESILPARQKFLPLTLTLNASFNLHSKKLSENHLTGYINFESQSMSDILFLESFHRFNENTHNYGDTVLGINLHTKKSLDGGIELSDLISYISYQTLRSKYSRRQELVGISDTNLDHIREIRDFMRKGLSIKLVDVTNN